FERPAEQRHLEPGEGQDRPEALHGEERADPTREHAGAGKKHLRPPHAERAVRADLDAQWFAVHGRHDGNAQRPLFKPPQTNLVTGNPPLCFGRDLLRSEERRVGKEWRSGWWAGDEE